MEGTAKSVMDHDDEEVRVGGVDRKGRGRELYSYRKHPNIGQNGQRYHGIPRFPNYKKKMKSNDISLAIAG